MSKIDTVPVSIEQAVEEDSQNMMYASENMPRPGMAQSRYHHRGHRGPENLALRAGGEVSSCGGTLLRKKADQSVRQKIPSFNMRRRHG